MCIVLNNESDNPSKGEMIWHSAPPLLVMMEHAAMLPAPAASAVEDHRINRFNL